MKLNGKTWEKWQARAAASPTLTKRQWWDTLTEDEKVFWQQMAEAFGPLHFMGARKHD